MFLIDDILVAPLKGLIWLGDKIGEAADREFSDEGLLKEKLMELQMNFELDRISESEYTRLETELLERLDEIRKLKEGM
ncbi:MAG: gas vesicle protein GvpG [Candidatus Wallbacteria bacterium]|nr:gas vesicle protein GvpG [Candidatus Wallbacteria bacterium]